MSTEQNRSENATHLTADDRALLANHSPRSDWEVRNAALPSVKCVCGHWDTEHAAFISNVRPGRTRTFCDGCDCHSWMTPEDRAEIDRERSRATVR